MAKVLMLLENPFPNDDRVEKEARSLIEDGHTCYLLCPDFTSKRYKYELYNGIHVIRFNIQRNIFKKLLGLCQLLPFYHLLWKFKAQHLVRKYGIEIVHVHDLPLCKTGVTLKKKYGLKFVADMHENYPAMVSGQEHIQKFPNKFLISVKKWYRLEKKWLPQADAIICTARGMVHRLHEAIGKQNYAVVPNTISLREFPESQVRDESIEARLAGSFNILSYGVVSEQRGIQYMIEAAADLKPRISSLRVIIVGRGSYLEELKKLAVKLAVDDIVSFEGWQAQSHLVSYVDQSALTVIPHIKSTHTDNTSPNKLFMFMYFGKPVISSNCDYIREIVDEEKCGLVFESGNSHQLAQCIETLYKDAELRQKMGDNAAKAIEQKYNWEKTVVPLKEIYLSLAT